MHQDEDGTLRVVDLATERQVKKMLQSQLGQQSQDGGTMVVQIQEPGSPSEHQVIQIEQQGSGIKQQVIEVQQPGGQVEQHVIEVEPGSEVKQTVVQVENDGQTQEVQFGLGKRDKPLKSFTLKREGSDSPILLGTADSLSHAKILKWTHPLEHLVQSIWIWQHSFSDALVKKTV